MNLQDLKIDATWTLFLDRDGVINRRIIDGYVNSWEQFEFLEGVPEAIARLSSLFGKVVVVSNQQGIGKGMMTGTDVQQIHDRMTEEIGKAGGRIDAVFIAPHLKSEGSVMRKPNIGMALKARKQFPEIRFSRAVMAGDSLSDMLFGKRAGMKTVLISRETDIARKHPKLVDFIFPDLASMAGS